MNEKNIVDITPNIATTYQHYKVAPYSFSSALFEYFDNSISSFMRDPNLVKNKEIQIIIDKIDKNEQNIYIIDNALGMVEDTFLRAIRIDNPPKNEFKNKFGLGLKVASCWFADNWSITSRSYEDLKDGDTFLYNFNFHMNDIIKNSSQKDYEYFRTTDEIVIDEFNKFNHGTIIKLTNVRHKFETNKSQVNKLIDQISRTYKTDIEALKLNFKIINLRLINGIYYYEDLIKKYNPSNNQLSLLRSLKNSSSIEPYVNEYFKLEGQKFDSDIDFTFSLNNKEYHVSGKAWWIQKSGVGKGGFDRKWKDRVIESKKWAPTEIFGKPNTYISQRMYGWLKFDDFDVSSNKTSFLISPEVEEKLFEELNKILRKLKAKINSVSRKLAFSNKISNNDKQKLIKKEPQIFKKSFVSLENIKVTYLTTKFDKDYLTAEHFININEISFTIRTKINDDISYDLISIKEEDNNIITAQINIRHPSLSHDYKEAHKVCLGLVVIEIWFWTKTASLDMDSIEIFNKIVGE